MDKGIPSSAKSKNETFLVYWNLFVAEFPDDEMCLEELYRRACVEGVLTCRHCGNPAVCLNRTARVVNCAECRKCLWFTAGTFFHHMRLPRAWLGAIWFMERGINVNPYQFHRVAGIAYSTAWSIFKKVAAVIKGCLNNTNTSLSSSVFLQVICRRSRETVARSHPISEDQAFHCADFSTSPPTLQCSDFDELKPEQRIVLDLIDKDEIHFDVICQRTNLRAAQVSSILTLLELDSLVVRKPGDRYVRADFKAPNHEGMRISNSDCAKLPLNDAWISKFMHFIRTNFQGISRKYLQDYIAIYWGKRDRTRWGFGALMQACLHHGPVRYQDILAYVTPRTVTVCLDNE